MLELVDDSTMDLPVNISQLDKLKYGLVNCENWENYIVNILHNICLMVDFYSKIVVWPVRQVRLT